MKIVIAGGTGFIGKYIAERFLENGDNVSVISRDKNTPGWDKENIISIIEGSDVLINFAGRNINCRHNKKNKKEILKSRIETTQILSDAISKCEAPPNLWLNASAAGIYSHYVQEPQDENSDLFADDFLSEVVRKWEETFFAQSDLRTRKVALRFSVVLGKTGGAFQPLKILTSLGLGGKQGSGKQIFSWIHIEDVFQVILHIIKNENLNGFINCTSPNPVTNNELMSALRKSLNTKIGIFAPKFIIYIGTWIIGTDPKLILESSNIIPGKLIDNGFEFKFNTIDSALKNLILT